jgi:hypothetical protein
MKSGALALTEANFVDEAALVSLAEVAIVGDEEEALLNVVIGVVVSAPCETLAIADKVVVVDCAVDVVVSVVVVAVSVVVSVVVVVVVVGCVVLVVGNIVVASTVVVGASQVSKGHKHEAAFQQRAPPEQDPLQV